MNSSLKTASLLALSVSTGMLGIGCAAEAQDPVDDGDELSQIDPSTGEAEEAAIAEEEQVGTSEDAFIAGGFGLGYGGLYGGYGLGYGGYGGYGLGCGGLYGGYGLGYGGYGGCGCGVGVGAVTTTTAVATTGAIGYGGCGGCGGLY